MKYKLTGQVTVSCYCEVEATSELDAVEKASALTPTLGGTNSGARADECWLIEEADGDVQEIRVEGGE